VVMTPVAVSTLRTRRLPASAMKRFPVASVASATGANSCAVVAGPLSPLNPLSPVPATVMMVPGGSWDNDWRRPVVVTAGDVEASDSCVGVGAPGGVAVAAVVTIGTGLGVAVGMSVGTAVAFGVEVLVGVGALMGAGVEIRVATGVGVAVRRTGCWRRRFERCGEGTCLSPRMPR